MNDTFAFRTPGDKPTVYIRPVEVSDLPKDVRSQIGGLKRVFAVHDVNGQPLALVQDRKLAFVLARQNDLSPVSVN